MIRSFSDKTTEKIFHSLELSRKEVRAFGKLDFQKAYERLRILHFATEKDLLCAVSLLGFNPETQRFGIE